MKAKGSSPEKLEGDLEGLLCSWRLSKDNRAGSRKSEANISITTLPRLEICFSNGTCPSLKCQGEIFGKEEFREVGDRNFLSDEYRQLEKFGLFGLMNHFKENKGHGLPMNLR